MNLEKLETLIDLQLIDIEEKLSTLDNFDENIFIQEYSKGYIQALNSTKLSWHILNNIDSKAVKEFASKQYLANYEKQKEIVGEVNNTGKPHLQGCFYQGKLEAFRFLENLIK